MLHEGHPATTVVHPCHPFRIVPHQVGLREAPLVDTPDAQKAA
jgi:hypothetical protein